MTLYCAIVDGYSSGKYLARFLHAQGFSCIHIQSTKEVLIIAKEDFFPEDYVLRLTNDGKLIETLSRYPLSFIISGSEPGVELAAALSEHFHLFSNGPDFGKNLRDKYCMGTLLGQNGLACIKQKKVSTLQDALDFAQDDWPVVLKPLDSGGGHLFHLCKNPQELSSAFYDTLGSKTLFEKEITEVLVQEYLQGEEYVVNTVSYNSHHYLESVWKYSKTVLPSGNIIDQDTTLVNPTDLSASLFAYTSKCLDAFGLKYGPAHSEVMLTKRGPVLIETGARIMGGDALPDLHHECLGHSQAELTTLAYSNPTAFLKYAKKPYAINKTMAQLLLVSSEEGILESVRFFDKIHSLRSFKLSRLHVSPGDYLQKTIDIPTSHGDVFLMHKDPKLLAEDIEKLRAWERQGMFVVRESCLVGV